MNNYGERTIVTRFGGKCIKCGDVIPAGEKVHWTPGSIRHVDEDGCSAVQDARAQDGFGDPEPRDWGDL